MSLGCFWDLDPTRVADSDLARSLLTFDQRMGLMFEVIDASEIPPAVGGIYLIAAWCGSSTYEALALGTTEDLSEQAWREHPIWLDFARLGASHIHYVVEPCSQARRRFSSALQTYFQRTGSRLSSPMLGPLQVIHPTV